MLNEIVCLEQRRSSKYGSHSIVGKFQDVVQNKVFIRFPHVPKMGRIVLILWLVNQSHFGIIPQCARNGALAADSGFKLNVRENVPLPELPTDPNEDEPVKILDFPDVDGAQPQLELLTQPRDEKSKDKKYLSLYQIDKEKPRWKIWLAENATKQVVAQFACRDNSLLFIWGKNVTAEGRSLLENSVLKITFNGSVDHLCLRKPVKVSAHGLDFFRNDQPEETVHAFEIPNCSPDEVLYLEVRPSDEILALGKLPEDKRRRTFGRNKKIKLEIKPNKFLTISLAWVAQRPMKKKKGDEKNNKNNMEVQQTAEFKVGRSGGLPLNNERVKKFREGLVKKIDEKRTSIAALKQKARAIQSNLRSVAGAQRGTKAWAQQTGLNNQFVDTNTRIKRSYQSLGKLRRDAEAQKALDKFVNAIDKKKIQYQIKSEAGDHFAALAQSDGWNRTTPLRYPLVGKWVAEDGTRMIVTKNTVTHVDPSNTKTTAKLFARDYEYGPCSTDDEELKIHEETNTTSMHLFFVTGRVALRREFSFSDYSPHIADEIYYGGIIKYSTKGKFTYTDWHRLGSRRWKQIYR